MLVSTPVLDCFRLPGSGFQASILGGSWVVINGVISKVTLIITHNRGLITTHEPPSKGL